MLSSLHAHGPVLLVFVLVSWVAAGLNMPAHLAISTHDGSYLGYHVPLTLGSSGHKPVELLLR